MLSKLPYSAGRHYSRLQKFSLSVFTTSLTVAAVTSIALGQIPILRTTHPALKPPQIGAILPPAPRRVQQVLVKFKPGVAPAEFAQIFSRKMGTVPHQAVTQEGQALTYHHSNSAIGWHVYRLSSPEALDSTLKALRHDPYVVKAEPDYIVRPTILPPNDPYWGREDWEHTVVVLSGATSGQNDTRLLDSSFWTYSWNLDAVNAMGGWGFYPGHYHTASERKTQFATTPEKLPLVAVLDTGIDLTHPDFSYTGNPSHGTTDTDIHNGGQLNVGLSRSFVNGNTDPNPLLAYDEIGHGTSVSGIIAAAPNNHEGVIGVGFPAQLMACKVLDATGTGNDSDLLDAIVYAVDQHAVLINASLDLDTTAFPQALQDAVDYAWNHGTLIVAAAGNDGKNGNDGQTPDPQAGLIRRYPASCVGVLGVSATTYGGDGVFAGETLASYSNYGDSLGVSAPGGDVTTFANTSPDGADLFNPIQEYVLIWTTAPTYQVILSDPFSSLGIYAQLGLYGLDYGYLPGTSFACPHVTGTAALFAARLGLKQAPGNPQRIINAVERGADQMNGRTDGGFDLFFGYGKVNSAGIVSESNNRNSTVGGCIGQVSVLGTLFGNITVTATKGSKSYTASTYADGIFHLENLPAGIYTVKASALGYSGQVTANIVAGADLHNVNLKLGELVQVSLTPQSISLPFGTTQQFTANVTGSSNTSVIWNLPIDAGATISATGLLRAPTKPGSSVQALVKATSVADPNRSASTSVTFTSKVSGKITLEECVNPIQLVTFEFRPTDGSPTLNRTTALSATGAFAFSDIPPADYNLAMKGAKWLRKVVLVTASAGNVSGIAVTLTAGDANNDNKVGLDDLGILSNAFDTKKGDKLFDDRADLNCDGRVDLDDLGLLSLHFDEIGDP